MNAVAIAYTTDLSRTAAAILVVGPIFDDDDDQSKFRISSQIRLVRRLDQSDFSQ